MIGKFKVGPIILITLGTVFLLNNFDILPWSIWNNLWKFWPLIIVLIGIEYMIGQTISLKTAVFLLLLIFLIPLLIALNPLTNNPLSTDKVAVVEELGTITKAKIIIDMPATNLEINSLKNSNKLIDGFVEYSKASDKPTIEKDETFDQKIIQIKQENSSGLPFISSLKNDLQLSLTNQIPLEILVNTEASREDFDLEDIRVESLEINSKASDINLKFGNSYSSLVKINSSASNVNITIPADMPARIKITSKVKRSSIADRFVEKSGVYTTEDFEKAFVRLDIQIESIAGTITVK